MSHERFTHLGLKPHFVTYLAKCVFICQNLSLFVLICHYLLFKGFMLILYLFYVVDSKSVTGGSFVFDAALFVLFVIICC